MEGTNSCSWILSCGKHTHTIVWILNNRTPRFFSLILLSTSILWSGTPFRVNIHSHKLTLYDTVLWSIIHTSPSLAKRGDVFSKGGKERKKEREKREKKWKERGHNEHRTRWTAAYSLLSFRHFRDPPRPRSLLPAHRSPITIPRDHKTDQSELLLVRDHDG